MLNGKDLPLLGLGTWQAKDEIEFENALETALDVGYRYFDTAVAYKNEHILGNFINKSVQSGKIKREEVFITTKLPNYGHSEPEKWIEASLKNLKTDYIDLFLIHSPMMVKARSKEEVAAGKSADEIVPHIETWRTLEKYYKAGHLKSIGVSNFNQQQIQNLFDEAEIKPMNLQVECHIFHPQHELHKFCQSLGITLTAFAPIGSPGRPEIAQDGIKDDRNPLKHELVQRLADKYHKTPAQVLIRQLIQRQISAIPKSTNPKRLKENCDVFDFCLTKEEMEEFDKIKTRQRLFLFDYTKTHPFHPWKNELKNLGLL